MSCLENIIGVHGVCGNADTESLSGYFITDYPGITLKTASQNNDEKTVTGYNYLLDLRRRAMMRLNNDIQAKIASDYRVNTLPAVNWNSGKFKDNVLSGGTIGNTRGIVAYKQKPHCRFYKIVLASVSLRFNYTGSVAITINDTAGYSYTINTTVTAGVVKKLNLNKIIEGNEVQILIPSEIPIYSATINCGVGCGGTPTNTCVRVNGVSNGNMNTSEGFGIIAEFLCKCDLSQIACDLATQNLIGPAAFELCGAMFFEEAIMNQRLNYMTIYQGDQLKEQADNAYSKYEQYLNNMFAGIRNYLVQYDGNCGCVDCSGVVIKTSV